MPKWINFQRSAKGDTIVEVLLSMAILALVLGTAFISTNHSLQNGVDAGNRNKALSYAQEQIEFMKNAAYQNLTSDISRYTSGNIFCVDPADGHTAIFSSDPGWHDKCETYHGSQYSLKINYSAIHVFTITANWTATNGFGQDVLKLYYKLP